MAFLAAARYPLGAAVTFYGGGIASGRFGTPSQIELASIYAKANPQRGRPRRRHLPKTLSVSISKKRLRSSSIGG